MSEGYGWIRSKVCEEFAEKQKQELIEEFLKDLHYVWNHPNHLNEYMELKEKWKERLKQ